MRLSVVCPSQVKFSESGSAERANITSFMTRHMARVPVYVEFFSLVVFEENVEVLSCSPVVDVGVVVQKL